MKGAKGVSGLHSGYPVSLISISYAILPCYHGKRAVC